MVLAVDFTYLGVDRTAIMPKFHEDRPFFIGLKPVAYDNKL